MCSFILVISKAPIDKPILEIANKHICTRGPDATTYKTTYNGPFIISTVHNLLDISGHSILQPLSDSSGNTLLFNGEIYSPSDGFLPDTKLLFEHLRSGNLIEFLKTSTGEYAVAAIDANDNSLTLFTDLIGTKPLFFGKGMDRIAVASYKSALISLGFNEIKEVPPNTCLKLNISNLNSSIEKKYILHNLSLEQGTSTLNEWSSAFIRSVNERAGHFSSKVFVPLSAGYDSGAICCALNKINVPYITATVGDSENQEIIEKRVEMNFNACCIDHYWLDPLSEKESNNLSLWLKEQLGEVNYDHLDGAEWEKPLMLHEDKGSVGLAVLCSEMSKRGFNTMLTGTGADEIISDYGHDGKKFFEHSEFGGKFPDELEGFFPWRKFYGDTQRSYLRKDEMVSGLFGIEGRYPYLDRIVIQTFLKLSPQDKNSNYKNCIANLLDESNYPYEANVKSGFYPLKTNLAFSEKVTRKLMSFFQ